MQGLSIYFNDSGAAGAPPQHYPNQEMYGTPFIFIDSGAASAPPQHFPNHEMMFNDYGAAGAPLQHFPYQEMHGILSFSMILESPAPHHRITQSRKCM